MKKVKNESTDTKPVCNRRKCCYDSGEASRKSIAYSAMGKQGKIGWVDYSLPQMGMPLLWRNSI